MKKMKNTLVFIESYIPGGSDKVARLLVDSIESEKIYLCINRSADTEILLQKIVNDNVKVIFYSLPTLFDISTYIDTMKNNNYLWYILKILSFIARYPLILFSIIYFYFMFKKLNIDLYISNNGGYPGGEYNRSSTISASIIGSCNVYHIFHSMAQPSRRIFRFIEYYYDKLIDNRCYLITDSQVSVDKMKSVRNIYQDISVIYNGVKKSKLKKYTLSNTLKLLHIGTLDSNKNQLLLVDIMNILVNELKLNVKLQLVGKEAEADYLLKLQHSIKEYNLKDDILLEGFSDDPYAYYNDTDILLLSSKVESFPTVILEAMSVGLPVITTDAGGVNEQIVNGLNGYIIKQNNIHDFVEKINYFYKDKNKIKEFGRFSYEHFNKNFRVEVMIKKYNILFKKGYR